MFGITAQLTQAATDRNLWANSYERDLRDALALQGEVARAIADEVNISLTPEERSRLASSRRVDPAAHEAYLKGRQQLDMRTRDSFANAVGHFQHAIEIDSTFAEAYAGLADAYALTGYMGFSPSVEAFARATAAARRSVALNESLAEAHTALAMASFFSWEWAAAEPEFKRAIALNPGFATAHHWSSHYLVARNRMPESLEASRRALALEPLNANITAHLAWAQYAPHGGTDEAIEQSRRTIDLDPNYYQGYLFRAHALVMKGKHNEAIADLTIGLGASAPGDAPRCSACLAVPTRRRAGTPRRSKFVARFAAESNNFAVNQDNAAFMFAATRDRAPCAGSPGTGVRRALRAHRQHRGRAAVRPVPIRAALPGARRQDRCPAVTHPTAVQWRKPGNCARSSSSQLRINRKWVTGGSPRTITKPLPSGSTS